MRDISDLLREWPYDPEACVRKVVAEDGRELLQVRTPLGIEQYELVGRPDGLRPHDCESVLEYVEQQLDRHIAEMGGPEGFEIDRMTAAELQQEGLIYYYRYLICFQVGEHAIVVRDTARNLRMFDLLKAYCLDQDVVHSSEQYRPYVLRMNVAARALLAIGQGKQRLAKQLVRQAIETIEALPDVPTETFEYEKQRSLAILRGMHKAIPDAKPPSEEDRLREEMARAIEEENYERAAQLRDRLRTLGAQTKLSPSSSRKAS